MYDSFEFIIFIDYNIILCLFVENCLKYERVLKKNPTLLTFRNFMWKKNNSLDNNTDV